MEAIDRVFFHELGHLIAGEIDRRFYYGSGVKKIELTPCTTNNNFYCGETFPVVPDDVVPNQPIAIGRLPKFLAAQMYGCFFQDYYCGETKFKRCLDMNGQKDISNWRTGLSISGWTDYFYECAVAEREHYQRLLDAKCLDVFLKIAPADYLVQTGEYDYEVDIQKLLNDLTDEIDEHFLFYNELIEQYETIFIK
jgi:hypothetical protein